MGKLQEFLMSNQDDIQATAEVAVSGFLFLSRSSRSPKAKTRPFVSLARKSPSTRRHTRRPRKRIRTFTITVL